MDVRTIWLWGSEGATKTQFIDAGGHSSRGGDRAWQQGPDRIGRQCHRYFGAKCALSGDDPKGDGRFSRGRDHPRPVLVHRSSVLSLRIRVVLEQATHA